MGLAHLVVLVGIEVADLPVGEELGHARPVDPEVGAAVAAVGGGRAGVVGFELGAGAVGNCAAPAVRRTSRGPGDAGGFKMGEVV